MHTHQINESHLGTEATPAQARRMAASLTKLGYPSEYNGTHGVSSRITDQETGEVTEIPDIVWTEALLRA